MQALLLLQGLSLPSGPTLPSSLPPSALGKLAAAAGPRPVGARGAGRHEPPAVAEVLRPAIVPKAQGTLSAPATPMAPAPAQGATETPAGASGASVLASAAPSAPASASAALGPATPPRKQPAPARADAEDEAPLASDADREVVGPTPPGKRERAIVVSVVDKYGFLRCERRVHDIFFHFTEVANGQPAKEGEPPVSPGDCVECQVRMGGDRRSGAAHSVGLWVWDAPRQV